MRMELCRKWHGGGPAGYVPVGVLATVAKNSGVDDTKCAALLLFRLSGHHAPGVAARKWIEEERT